MESQNVFNKEGNGAQRRPAAKFRTGPAAMFGRRLVGTGAVTFPYRVRFDAVVSGKLLADDFFSDQLKKPKNKTITIRNRDIYEQIPIYYS